MGKDAVNDSIERLIDKHKRWLAFGQSKNKIVGFDKGNKSGSQIPTEIPFGITVITSTIRPEFIDNIFENYSRQTYQNKELIIVLNKNSMDISHWKEKATHYPRVRIFQLDEEVSLGECYNFCVEESQYNYIAPFDDDDYYGPNYLKDIIEAFSKSGADVVGKRARFIYFENSGLLAISGERYENRYVTYIDGPTLSFNKKIFDRVQFTSVPCGVDVEFCRDCVANNIKIYSTNRHNHVYIRHTSSHHHTWKISDQALLLFGGCRILGKIKNYQEYISR